MFWIINIVANVVINNETILFFSMNLDFFFKNKSNFIIDNMSTQIIFDNRFPSPSGGQGVGANTLLYTFNITLYKYLFHYDDVFVSA